MGSAKEWAREWGTASVTESAMVWDWRWVSELQLSAGKLGCTKHHHMSSETKGRRLRRRAKAAHNRDCASHLGVGDGVGEGVGEGVGDGVGLQRTFVRPFQIEPIWWINMLLYSLWHQHQQPAIICNVLSHLRVGDCEGRWVGDGVGASVGFNVGNCEGGRVGTNVGNPVGDGVGAGVGDGVGTGVGLCKHAPYAAANQASRVRTQLPFAPRGGRWGR